MSERHAEELPASDRSIDRITIRLKLAFAILTCLGGLVLASGPESESVSMFAIFMTIFGFIFVDCLKTFSLPPVVAYAAMGLAALYSVGNFFDDGGTTNQQMLSVARLLVLVQSIMMLQKKTRRIFEQLGVFCLLELVVAGVFNNAMHYGILMLAICIVGAWGLSVLSAVVTAQGIGQCDLLTHDENSLSFFSSRADVASIEIAASSSAARITKTGIRLPRITLLALTPSILVVGAVFFFALPRTIEASRTSHRSKAVVGFTDEVSLAQVGQMGVSPKVALRVQFNETQTGKAYDVSGGVYLRGSVLERYVPGLRGSRQTAKWTAADSVLRPNQPTTPPFDPFRQDASSDSNADRVSVSITRESSSTGTLFSVAPYFQEGGPLLVEHHPVRWTLSSEDGGPWVYPRVRYDLGTRVFHNGIQASVFDDRATWGALSRASADEPNSDEPNGDEADGSDQPRSLPTRRVSVLARPLTDELRTYLSNLLQFDPFQMPRIEKLAEEQAVGKNGEARTSWEIAKACEEYFLLSPEFDYSLNLDAKSVPGMDPIEQFVSVDKRGHCQYYASALAMMLRSQGIPARLVVGYNTDEVNPLSRQYIARQLHAHSWVEALIERRDIPAELLLRVALCGNQALDSELKEESDSDLLWVRLDATPRASRQRSDPGATDTMIDYAQGNWDDYFVGMDPKKQKTLFGVDQENGTMQRAYSDLVEKLRAQIKKLDNGELGGGALSANGLGVLPFVAGGAGAFVLGLILLRFRFSRVWKGRRDAAQAQAVAKPHVDFYLKTLEQLQRMGIAREHSQTATELAIEAGDKLQHPLVPSIQSPLKTLTQAYYRRRFGEKDMGSNSHPPIEGTETMGDAREQDSVNDPSWDEGVVNALAELSSSIDLMAIEEVPGRRSQRR